MHPSHFSQWEFVGINFCFPNAKFTRTHLLYHCLVSLQIRYSWAMISFRLINSIKKENCNSQTTWTLTMTNCASSTLLGHSHYLPGLLHNCLWSLPAPPKKRKKERNPFISYIHRHFLSTHSAELWHTRII